MSLAVLIMQIQGQLKNLQVVRDLQGQGIYHYSWVAVEVTIMRPCIDFEDKTGCGPTIAGQILMVSFEKEPIFMSKTERRTLWGLSEQWLQKHYCPLGDHFLDDFKLASKNITIFLAYPEKN